MTSHDSLPWHNASHCPQSRDHCHPTKIGKINAKLSSETEFYKELFADHGREKGGSKAVL